jgi:methyl-accepting chemotaxis protein
MMAEFTPEELSTVGDAMTNVASNVGELSTQLGDIRNFTQNQNRTNDLIIALNTTMTEVAELLEENNSLTKGTRNAIAENGDMMVG